MVMVEGCKVEMELPQIAGPGSAAIIAAAVAAYASSQEKVELFKLPLLALAVFFALLFIWIESKSFKERQKKQQ